MATPRDLRRRIRSVKSTAQITKAMQMVAAAKMRKAQQAALAGRPYAILMNRVLVEVVSQAGDFVHPLTEKREVRKRGLVAVSTDKGLCGALNGNLARELMKYDRTTTVFVAAGRKASQFLARTKRQLVGEFTYKDSPLFDEARAISRAVREMFIKEEVDQVEVLFTQFVNTLSQRPRIIQFLPVKEIKPLGAGVRDDAQPGELNPVGPEYLFEPSADQVLGAMLPHYLNYIMYQILLEARASEQSARMVAMKNATDNANQLIKDLTLEYNKLRQSNITKELLEIATAQMALG
jgi:F-type H+-transporting ATPase subunit gamma